MPPEKIEYGAAKVYINGVEFDAEIVSVEVKTEPIPENHTLFFNRSFTFSIESIQIAPALMRYLRKQAKRLKWIEKQRKRGFH